MKFTFFIIPLFFILPTIILSSCDNKSTVSTEKARQRFFATRDSLQKLRLDSLSKIAWGDTYFGMSVNEALKTKTLKNAEIDKNIKYPFQTLRLFSKTNIDGISAFHFYFFKDRLYLVLLASSILSATYYDTDIKKTVNHLYELVEKKYGAPTNNYGFPSFLKMRPSESVTAYEWWIGDKHISLEVSEVKSGSEYWAVCFISSLKGEKIEKDYLEKTKKEEEAKKLNGF